VPDFSVRTRSEELMDDFSITDSRLKKALDELRYVNRYLGGYTTTMAALRPFLQGQAVCDRTVHILDLGTGIADTPEYIVQWADRNGIPVEIVALDANPATVDYASQVLDKRLTPALRSRIQLVTGNALAPGFESQRFDVVMASLFLHHFVDEDALRLLTTMQRLARHGIIVNDLHRHRAAFYSIYSIGHLLPVSPMFRNDGPVSVLRGFSREELGSLATRAGLPAWRLTWHWAFRWCLTTLQDEPAS
jgi:SAM-dependent methyltransferase